MTQEDKELLLKDLCARLPYGVIALTEKGKGHVCDVNLTIFGAEIGVNVNPTARDTFNINDVKLYLFPLSSMNEEQLHELKYITDFRYNHNTLELVKWTETHKTLEFWLEEVPQYEVVEVFDWLNKNHFDYRGLIEKGLAIDATGLNIYQTPEEQL